MSKKLLTYVGLKEYYKNGHTNVKLMEIKIKTGKKTKVSKNHSGEKKDRKLYPRKSPKIISKDENKENI